MTPIEVMTGRKPRFPSELSAEEASPINADEPDPNEAYVQSSVAQLSNIHRMVS